MPLIRLRADVEKLALWLITAQLADVTPHVSEYGPTAEQPLGVVRVHRVPGVGGLDNEYGVEQALIEVSAWAWDSTTVDGRQLALDLVSTAQSALLLAQRNNTPTPFGCITSWRERTPPTENRNGTVPDRRTWMQATSGLTVVPSTVSA